MLALALTHSIVTVIIRLVKSAVSIHLQQQRPCYRISNGLDRLEDVVRFYGRICFWKHLNVSLNKIAVIIRIAFGMWVSTKMTSAGLRMSGSLESKTESILSILLLCSFYIAVMEWPCKQLS